MTKLDDELVRLARRMSVARLALAHGGPVVLLESVLGPVQDSLNQVVEQMHDTYQVEFAPVDQPIGPATTDVLATLPSPPPPSPEEIEAVARMIQEDDRADR